ncbi:MAG: hypothetical protein Q9194_003165 [Teloschistes cf. exilis]
MHRSQSNRRDSAGARGSKGKTSKVEWLKALIEISVKPERYRRCRRAVGVEDRGPVVGGEQCGGPRPRRRRRTMGDGATRLLNIYLKEVESMLAEIMMMQKEQVVRYPIHVPNALGRRWSKIKRENSVGW